MGYMTPLHLLALGGPLIDAGFTDTALIDAQNDDLDLKETIAAILDQKFEIVFISAMAATAASPLVLSVMRGVKAINPNVYLVTGGVHASYEYETMMRDYPDLDFIGRGEGEQFAVDLVTCLEEKGDLGRVKSLVWRKNGKITVNEKASKLPDLDVYRVGWELIEDWSKYRVPMTGELGAVVQFLEVVRLPAHSVDSGIFGWSGGIEVFLNLLTIWRCFVISMELPISFLLMRIPKHCQKLGMGCLTKLGLDSLIFT
jgi:anaerobic magnesium-protoporphyrin IX monomethyl ester cyclase